ncbi:hypothetical protein D9M68_571460 [compost metagenome]
MPPGGADADGIAHGVAAAVRCDRRDRMALHAGADALRHRTGAGLAGRGQQHHELFAAETAQQVAGPQLRRRQSCERLQHGIAGRVAVGVVDRLEMVDVDDQQRGGRLAAGGARQLAAGAFLECLARQHAGQRVGIGDRFEPAHDGVMDHQHRAHGHRGHHQRAQGQEHRVEQYGFLQVGIAQPLQRRQRAAHRMAGGEEQRKAGRRDKEPCRLPARAAAQQGQPDQRAQHRVEHRDNHDARGEDIDGIAPDDHAGSRHRRRRQQPTPRRHAAAEADAAGVEQRQRPRQRGVGNADRQQVRDQAAQREQHQRCGRGQVGIAPFAHAGQPAAAQRPHDGQHHGAERGRDGEQGDRDGHRTGLAAA